MKRSMALSILLLGSGILLVAGGLYFRHLASFTQGQFDTNVAPFLAEIQPDLDQAAAYRDTIQGMVLRGEGVVRRGLSPRGFFPSETLVRIDNPSETSCRGVGELRVVAQTVGFLGPSETLSAAIDGCRKAGFRVVSLSVDPAANGFVRAETTFRSFQLSTP